VLVGEVGNGLDGAVALGLCVAVVVESVVLVVLLDVIPWSAMGELASPVASPHAASRTVAATATTAGPATRRETRGCDGWDPWGDVMPSS
jgi:hypothetical protein